MKKLLILILLLIPVNIYALDLNSKAYIVYDEDDNNIILEKNSNEIRSIASLTKIMSAIVAIENNNLTDEVQITQEMLNTVPYDAYVIHLKAGDVVTVQDLLMGTLIASGADAVNSLAVATTGSIDAFVDLMNEKAVELGLDNTHFQNPIGMDDPNHYSTANDILTLMKYALKNQIFVKMFETKYYKLSNGIEVYATSSSFGQQIGVDTARILGDKTGYTTPAEFCIAYEFVSHDHLYYAVLLGAPVDNFQDFKHIRDAISIIQYVDEAYSYQDIIKESSFYKSISVVDSTIDTYNIYNSNDISVLLDVYDPNKLVIEDNLPESISYRNKKGDILGVIKYYYNNELIKEDTIILTIDIEPNLKEYIKIHIKELIALTVIGILLLIIIIYWLTRHKKVVK